MGRMTRRYGQIIRVSEDEIGSALVADTAAGASELTVRNAADFDEDRGGKLSINGQVIAYTKVDDDTGLITLGGALAADADEGDQVALYDAKRDVIVVEKTALVEVGEGKSDAIHATIAAHLVRQLPEGPRGDDDGESVVIERDEDGDWTVVDVLGLGDLAASGLQFWDKDTHTVTVGGAQEVTLTHEPVEGSLHIILWGWYTLQHGEFSVDGKTVTIPDPTGALEAEDVIDYKYAYLVGVATPTLTTSVIPYESTGWKYLAVSSSDNTNRSAVELDDSAWATGQAGFGEPAGSQSLGQVNTYVPHSQGVWLRRHLPGGGAHSIKLRIDGSVRAYWNGALVGSWAQFGETAAVPIPQELVRGDQNVIAIFHFDYDQPNAVNMIDVQITSEVSA